MTYAEVLTALADPTRRHIFEQLREQPKTVGQLAAAQTVSRPAVSQHLRVLESANLVSVEPQGNRRVYSANREGLDELKNYLESFWSDVLAAYGEEVVRQRQAEAGLNNYLEGFWSDALTAYGSVVAHRRQTEVEQQSA